MFKKLRNGFLIGVALFLPILLTIIVIRWVVTKLNDLVLNPILLFLQPFIPDIEFIYLLILIKICLFLLIILLIALIGLAANNLALKRLFSFWESLLFKIPLINKVYITIKQISNAFLGGKRHIFQSVVLIEYPRKGLYCLGFVTSPIQKRLQDKLPRDSNGVNIFVPTTPNPTSGFLLLVPKKEIISLDISVEEGMKLVISGGIV